MRTAWILCLLVLGCLGDVSQYFATQQSASATWYNPDLVGGGEGHCSLMRTGQVPAMAYVSRTVAINSVQFQQSEACGMCMEIVGTGTHHGQPVSTEPQIVMVTDSCPYKGQVCADGNVFLANMDAWNGTAQIEWRAVSCPGEIGPLQYYLHNSNQWNIQLQVRNHRVPIQSVTMTMDGHTAILPRTIADNFFLWSSPKNAQFTGGPIQLEITSADGQTIQDTISSEWLDKEYRNIGPIMGDGAQFLEWQGNSAAPLSADEDDELEESFFVPSSVIDLYEVSQNGSSINDPLPTSGKCHLDLLPSDETWLDISVSPTNFLRGQACGVCMEITDADGSVHVGRVTGLCDDCQGGSIRLHDELPSPVQWQAVSCPHSPPVNMTYLSFNSTLYWINFQVLNPLAPIQAVYLHTLDGRVQAPSSPNDDGTFVYFAPSATYRPFNETLTVEICSVVGECVQDRVNFTRLMKAGLPIDGLDGTQLTPLGSGMVPRTSPLGSGVPDYRGDYLGALPPPNDGQLYFRDKSVTMDSESQNLWVLLNGTKGQMSYWMTTYSLRVSPGNSIHSLSMRNIPGTHLGSLNTQIGWEFFPKSSDKTDFSIGAHYHSGGTDSGASVGQGTISASQAVDFTVKISMNKSGDSVTSSLAWTSDGDDQRLVHVWANRSESLSDLGVLGFQLFPRAPGPSVSNIVVSTTVVARVDFDDYIDLKEVSWEWLFFHISGIDQSTTTIEVIETETYGLLNDDHVRELGFTITSTQGTAATKAQQFLVAANGPPGAANKIARATMVDGSVGAQMAGFPTNRGDPDGSGDFTFAIITWTIVGVTFVCLTLMVVVIFAAAVRFSVKHQAAHSPLDHPEPGMEMDDLYDQADDED